MKNMPKLKVSFFGSFFITTNRLTFVRIDEDENRFFILRVPEIAQLDSTMREKMREEMSGIYGGGFYCSVSKRPYEHFSAGLSFPCGPENVDKLIAAALAEIENIKTNGPKEEDLAKIKQQWTEQHRESVKDNGYWLGELHSIQLFKADPDRMLNYDKYLAALTVKDVQEAAKIIFGGPNRATAVMYPEKK
jgi:zinc protease